MAVAAVAAGKPVGLVSRLAWFRLGLMIYIFISFHFMYVLATFMSGCIMHLVCALFSLFLSTRKMLQWAGRVGSLAGGGLHNY